MGRKVFFGKCSAEAYRQALGIALLLFLSACERAPATSPAVPPSVEVMQAIRQDVPVYKEWVSTLDGMVNAQISAQVTGYLVKQHFKEGDLVRKGQLLYEIDPRTFQATLNKDRATLAKQEAVLKTASIEIRRIERLLPENAVSVRDRDTAAGREASATAEVWAAKATVVQAELDLEFTRIKSPINGIVGISKAQIGDLVGPTSSSTALTIVSQVDPIRAYNSLSEQEYLYFAREQLRNGAREPPQVELILADGSTYEHRGTFYFADRQVDAKTGSIQVAALFPNPQQILRPGQFGRLRAKLGMKNNALLVPQRAVLQIQDRYQVAIVNPDSKIAMRNVTAGERIGSLWVIDKGIEPEDRVVVQGVQKVREGMVVTPAPYHFSEELPKAETADNNVSTPQQ
ncbi:efflux RND transporter periplasmic adaptor subunit [Candidatus Methylospira mobilis]|uniref:Efflux RND transporter periplasmic adaptor subunit n=1 Tax=Candidatus Methylospira mobilis TaxID=1808979 RepID=A0A5Q0BBE1_9GAMM|nr:efflux RND transporter periplasmic adaptor subunit [Candidatus Methylospira mobilis]QFY41273.1 efflux RND transporter periplasmic adaptor subunit [Candidatus Methylospira mobilis]WNV05505.1 efflux RND transporter periplasmic adaptor subunit [Candidatus Methylospira mobilis]